MQLATNWRDLWKAYSTQALFIIGAVQILASHLPQSKFLPWSVTYTWADLVQLVTGLLALAGFIGRYVDQPKVSGDAS